VGKIQPVEDPTRSEEYRAGRNFIRRGDLVRVAPREGSPDGTHGQPARFQYVAEDKGGLYACVQRQERTEKGVWVGNGYEFVKPERLERKATTHDPLRQAAERAQAKKEAKK